MSYRFLLEPGEELAVGGTRRFRVVDVRLLEEQGADVVALLYVEAC